MTFKLEEIEQESFRNWEDLNSYVKEEAERYVRIPIETFFTHHAKFTDDQFFGNNGCWVKFNDEGMKSFYRLINIPSYFLEKLSENGLVSSILNNYLTGPNIRALLRNYQFVLDKKNMTVSGLVSKTYVPYSNNKFLEDITQIFPELIFKFEIEESYMVNTNLYLRLLSPDYEGGLMDGYGGQTKDISKIGIQLSNGMTGRSSIKASFFVYRLVCSNGLILPCTEVNGTVKHSGKKDTFLKRIANNITPVIEKIRDVPKQIQTLGAISFDLEKLAELDGTKYVFDIIPLGYWDQRKRGNLRGEEKARFDIDKIEGYIDTYALEHSKKVFIWRENQSMYDFINIFTEYAQTQKPRERTKIEEKSGELANWILKNKIKFD
jgi:hypothetical protein